VDEEINSRSKPLSLCDLSDPDYYNQLVKGNVWEATCENGNRREDNNRPSY